MTATSLTRERSTGLAAFYAAHQHQLTQRVQRRAPGVGDAVVADACAHAWLQLVRRRDVRLDRDGLAWLTVVAMREAWRLADASRERPAGPMLAEPLDDRELPEPAGPAGDPLECALAAELHRERVARFATLKARERRDLLPLAGGYRYDEIAELTDSSYSAVNHRLSEGRARLRRQ